MTINKKYQELYHFQDKLLEHKVERFTGKFAVSIGYFIERAGDIYRELFKHGGEFIDFGYIESKMVPLRNEFGNHRDTTINLREVREGRDAHPRVAAAYDAYAILYLLEIDKMRRETRKRVTDKKMLHAAIGALDVITALVLWGMMRRSPDQVNADIKTLDKRITNLRNQFYPR